MIKHSFRKNVIKFTSKTVFLKNMTIGKYIYAHNILYNLSPLNWMLA